MIDEPRVLPECEADTTLVNFLLDRNTNHKSSINKVDKGLRDTPGNRLVIGIVDNDKRQPPYFSNFEVQRQQEGLILKHYPNTRQYLIVLNPAIEQLLIHCTEQLNKINPKYERFTNLDKLKGLTKSQAIQRDKAFKDFLNMLSQKQVTPIITLKNWLQELLNTQ